MADDLERLLQEARDRIGGASLRAALEEARVSLLGRNAELTQRLRGIATLPGGVPIVKNGQVVGGIGVFPCVPTPASPS